MNHTELFLISDAPAEIEKMTGNRVHVSTIHRWRQRGRHGVRLRTQMGIGGRYTSRRWIQEFFSRVTAAADEQESAAVGSPVATASSRSRHERAEQELAAAGI